MSGEYKSYEEKANALEKLLQQATQAAKTTIGVIEAGPSSNGLYRVMVGSKIMLVPSKTRKILNSEDSVIIIEHEEAMFIQDKLPEDLHKVQETPDFKPVYWSDIAGVDSQVERIREAVEFPLENAAVFAEFNVPTLKGLMLYGPPGCGKTMIAKAIATTVLKKHGEIDGKSFVYVKGAELLSSYVGMAESNIKNIFDGCRKHYEKTKQRAILFIDEAEAILPVRGSRVSSDVDTTIVPTFLAEMDGFQEGSPFVILATNFPNRIDSAIQRAGRIDLKVEVSRPTESDTAKIFELYLKKTLCSEKPEILGAQCASVLFKQPEIEDSVSGAMIATLVTQGVTKAVKRYITNPKQEKKGVNLQDITQVITAKES